MPSADLLGDLGGRCDAFEVLGHVEIGLVERQRLDQRRVLGEDGADLLRDLPIDVEAVLHEDQLGAFALGGDGRHRRAHAEFARLITRSRHDAARLRPADRDRLAAQLGMVTLFDRGEEGVHVDMDDLARPPCRGGDVRAFGR
jgi:hypothetical protein